MSLKIAELPLELAMPVRGLMQAAETFRKALLASGGRPGLGDGPVSAATLVVADQVLDAWIAQVGPRLATPEEAAAADAVGRNPVQDQTTEGGASRRMRQGGKRPG